MPLINILALISIATPLVLLGYIVGYNPRYDYYDRLCSQTANGVGYNPGVSGSILSLILAQLGLHYQEVMCLFCLAHGALEIKAPYRVHASGLLKPELASLAREAFRGSISRMDGIFIAMLSMVEPASLYYYPLAYLASLLLTLFLSILVFGELNVLKKLWVNYDLIIGLLHIGVAAYMLLCHFGLAPWI